MSDSRRPPRKGTVLRAAWDAAHAYWCGPNCPCGPGCKEWAPAVGELQAIIDAVRGFDAQPAGGER